MRRSFFLLLAGVAAVAEAFMTSPQASGLALAPNRLPAISSARPASSLVAPQMVDVSVQVNDGENIESAIRRFKIACSKSGHIQELRRRRYFETNNEKKIRKDKEAARKRRMAKLNKNRQF